MFNIGFSELLILAVIALIFIGPKELPEIARVIGRMLNELKRATGDLTATWLEPTERLREEFKNTMDPNHAGDKLEPAPPAQDEKKGDV